MEFKVGDVVDVDSKSYGSFQKAKIISIYTDKVDKHRTPLVYRDQINQSHGWILSQDQMHSYAKIGYDTENIDDLKSYFGKRVAFIQEKEIVNVYNNASIKTKTISNGCKCKRCNEYYEYAEPNQPDGVSLICYSCRY